MITKEERKDVKNNLYTQLMVAIIYIIIGIVLSIKQITNSNYNFDTTWYLAVILLVVGIIFIIRNTLILFNSRRLNNKIIKTYDPSNKDIKLKTIKRAYYTFYALGLIFAVLMLNISSEASVGVIMIMTITLLMHGLYWLYYKISYNMK